MAFTDLVSSLDAAVLGTMGVPTTYAPAATGQPIPVTGVFNAAYVRADAGEAGVSTAEPMVFYRLEDLPVDPELDFPEIVIDGVSYEIAEVKKDGQGGVRLCLHQM